MSLSYEEKETVIVFNEAEKTAQIYTCTASIKRKLESLCEQYPDEYKRIDSNNVSSNYIIPKRRISIRGPRPIISDERKEELRERMKKYHAKKKGV